MTIKNSSNKASRPYAEALFESSQVISLVEKTKDNLESIASVLKQSNVLVNFLTSPLISIEAKKKVLNHLFVDRVSPHVLNFLFILIERRRINLFNSIVNDYISLVNQLDLVTLVSVSTVMPLSEDQITLLTNRLQSLTKSKVIKLNVEIRPDLLGGLVLKIGSKVIDMSIYGQLSQLSSQLNGRYL